MHFFVWIALSWTNAGALLCGETLYSSGWPIDWILLEPHPDRPDQADAPICAVALSVGCDWLSAAFLSRDLSWSLRATEPKIYLGGYFLCANSTALDGAVFSKLQSECPALLP